MRAPYRIRHTKCIYVIEDADGHTVCYIMKALKNTAEPVNEVAMRVLRALNQPAIPKEAAVAPVPEKPQGWWRRLWR